ncbi:MAG: OmpA family protein [Formosimonas sp.]
MNRKIKLLAIGLSLSLSAVAGARDVEHKWCPPETPAPPAPKTERVNLSADALFRFDKAASTDLLPAGKQTLDELGNALRTEYAAVDGIALIGHTDRLGNDKYNYNLGLKRAHTVKSYLQNLGVTAPISVGSAGETQPVTNCQGTKPTAELKACLQPDRRVSLDITGIRKK